MKTFLIENWRLLLECALVLVSSVLFIVRKKPVKVVDTLKEVIVRILPALINAAELKDGIKGKDKLAYVLAQLKEVLRSMNYGDDIVDQYLPFATEQVEIILSTPQKKGKMK